MRYLLVAAAVLVAAPLTASAQVAVISPKAAEAIKTEIASIKSRMNLTADQETKLRGYLEDAANDFDKLDADYTKKEKSISDKYRKKMRGVLTPEQQTTWDTIKSEYRAKLKGM